jgi:hypothetical protein
MPILATVVATLVTGWFGAVGGDVAGPLLMDGGRKFITLEQHITR